MRLIDADDFDVITYKETESYSDCFDSGVLYMLDRIDAAPTIDAEPIRHGHWEIDETDGSYTCECGLIMWNNDLVNGNANYCPNCGAKMDEEATE